jgi:hypothetical protein
MATARPATTIVFGRGRLRIDPYLKINDNTRSKNPVDRPNPARGSRETEVIAVLENHVWRLASAQVRGLADPTI